MIALFATIELAVKAALTDAYNCGEQRRECGGVIYEVMPQKALKQDMPQYTYSAPVTSNQPFGVEIPQLAEVPLPGMTLKADYHNHPCLRGNAMFAHYFSPADALVDQGFHVIGYMLDGCTGDILRFDPNEFPREVMVVHFTSGRELELPLGHISGWIDVYVH